MGSSSPDRDAVNAAQWQEDARLVLDRLELDIVDVAFERGQGDEVASGPVSFMSEEMERRLAVSVAATSIATRLFGRFGEGAGADKQSLNRVKKHADGVSAYTLSEGLFHATRELPENHALMVSLGEGLMAKGGESPEMGSNPNLGFGRVYARPDVARWLDERTDRLLNDDHDDFDAYHRDAKQRGITIWGAAIDTLENTSRFAKGEETGPMSVLHVFDQPMLLRRPYEGYIGALFVPEAVARAAAEHSRPIDYTTHRGRVVEAIESVYPDIRPANIHVWTLGGSQSRADRLDTIWRQWREAGAHIVDADWELPTGDRAFVDSGTYAPTFLVRSWTDDAGETHVFLTDGYAASAEALQAATLAPALGLHASLAVLSSRFRMTPDVDQQAMSLDPDAEDFGEALSALAVRAGREFGPDEIEQYARSIREARDAGVPLGRTSLTAGDFFPDKEWESLAVLGYICRDPYTGTPGVERRQDDRTWCVRVRLAGSGGRLCVALTLRMRRPQRDMQSVYEGILGQLIHGDSRRDRPVLRSEAGRIKNELKTLVSEALEIHGDRVRLHPSRIPDDVIPSEDRATLIDALRRFREEHPACFGWLEIAD